MGHGCGAVVVVLAAVTLAAGGEVQMAGQCDCDTNLPSKCKVQITNWRGNVSCKEQMDNNTWIVLTREDSKEACVKGDTTGSAGTDGDVFYKLRTSTCIDASPDDSKAKVISLEMFSEPGCAAKSKIGSVVADSSAECRLVEVGPGYKKKKSRWDLRFILIVALTPFVTGIIGYGTNVLAIKMIFRPYKPKCGFSITMCGPSKKNPGVPKCYWKGFQGVFPKRQHSLAVQIGEMVEKNLISAEEMVSKMKKEMGVNEAGEIAEDGSSSLDDELSDGVRNAVRTMLDKKADTPGFGMFLNSMGGKDAFTDNLARGTVTAFKANLPLLMETFAASFTQYIPFKDIIMDRIRHKMTPADLEDMFMSFMAAELGFVEQLGGILGFGVGIIQGCIFIIAGA